MSLSFVRRARPATGVALLIALAAVAAGGCGPSMVKITGVVKHKNQPLPGGTVTFQLAQGKGNTVTATISPEGRFEATVPAGELLVAVDNRGVKQNAALVGISGGAPDALQKKGGSGRPGGPPGAAKGPSKGANMGPPAEAVEKMKQEGKGGSGQGEKLPGTYVEIDSKYYSTDSSGKKITVDSSTKEVTIDLD